MDIVVDLLMPKPLGIRKAWELAQHVRAGRQSPA
jgi:hypothetical protein